MIRVREVTIEGATFSIASMSVSEAEKFVAEGNEFLKQARAGELKAEDWLGRRDRAIIASIKKAVPDSDITIEKLKSEFDLVVFEQLFSAILAHSGLKPGEVTATLSPSEK